MSAPPELESRIRDLVVQLIEAARKKLDGKIPNVYVTRIEDGESGVNSIRTESQPDARALFQVWDEVSVGSLGDAVDALLGECEGLQKAYEQPAVRTGDVMGMARQVLIGFGQAVCARDRWGIDEQQWMIAYGAFHRILITGEVFAIRTAPLAGLTVQQAVQTGEFQIRPLTLDERGDFARLHGDRRAFKGSAADCRAAIDLRRVQPRGGSDAQADALLRDFLQC